MRSIPTETIPEADYHEAVRKIPARVRYLLKINEGGMPLDRHELENPIAAIAKGDEITLWKNGPKDLVVRQVTHVLERDLHWLTQIIVIDCVRKQI